MSLPIPSPDPAGIRRRRTLVLSLVAGALVIALIVIAAVIWSSRDADAEPAAVAVTATIDGTPVGVEPVAPTGAQAAALADLGAPGYLALHPFTVDAASVSAVSGELVLELTLPAEVPPGAFVTFARYAPEIDAWEPVATTLATDAVTVTTRAMVQGGSASGGGGGGIRSASLSAPTVAGGLWTAVIGGIDSAVQGVEGALSDAGAAVASIADGVGDWWTDASADWSADFALGSQWVMRASRELYGTAADVPECAPDADGAVPWITDTVISDNAMIAGLGLEGGNAAVLLCAGPDPADPTLLQVRAAANRAYGFSVVFPAGLEPRTAGMDALDISTSALIDAGYAVIASGGDLLVNPGRFILPTQTYSVTVDEAAVRASQAQTGTARVIEYALPTFPQALLSGVLGVALAELDPEDFFGGALGVFFLARDCDFAQWGAGVPWTELLGAVSTCLETLDSDALQKAAAEVARDAASGEGVADGVAGKVAEEVAEAASGEAADRAAAFVSGGAEKARKVIAKLGWLTWFSISQTATDYIADAGTEEISDLPAWFVNATLAAEPTARWEDVEGRWCGITYPSCTPIVLGTTVTEWGTSTITFEAELGECFAGIGADDPGSGANIVYCPAGAPTPAGVPGAEPGMPPTDDNVDFDRVFIYQGYGTAAWFREEDVAAVRG